MGPGPGEILRELARLRMARIFISYRRTDASGYAGLLYQHLAEHYRGEIFLDRNRLEDGDRWDREIASHLQDCDALLVVIGPNWLKAQDEESGQRKLDHPDDWVRREVETGLQRGVRVIPVLMGDGRLPKREYLPVTLRDLASLEARTVSDRDTRDDVRRLAEQLQSAIGEAPERARDTRRYLEMLREETGNIDIRGLQVGAGKAYRFPIEDLYIPLKTAPAAQQRNEQGRPGEPREPVDLQELLRSRRLVIVGDPGSGKTTFLRRMAFALIDAQSNSPATPEPEARSSATPEPEARSFLKRLLMALLTQKFRSAQSQGPAPFPILIRVAELLEHIRACGTQSGRDGPTTLETPEWLIHYLETKSRERGWGLDGLFFRSQLGGGAIVLLDGLDEAADTRERTRMARIFENATATYTECRFVVTTRPLSYTDVSILAGFERAEIEPLGDEAIAAFLEHWCQALFPGNEVGARQHLGELSEALRRSPAIQRMAQNPVMLTALAVVHWNERRLPEQRAELYESILLWLARAREAKPGRVSADRCLELLRKLALAMQSHERGRQVQVARAEAAEALALDVLARAQQFLEEEEADSGIIVSRGSDVRFWHLSFQEYLAARAIAGLGDAEQYGLLLESGRIYQTEWRETVLLLAGVLARQGSTKVEGLVRALLDGLGESASLADQARCAGLLGAIVRDLRPLGYEPVDARYSGLWKEVLGVFEKRAAEIPFATRLEAAEALGQAGDPRLEQNNWVKVEGGRFWMGAQKENAAAWNYSEEASDSESPVHPVEISAFYLGRYPVTVFEYKRFVGVGGYRKEPFWTAGGYTQFTEPDNWRGQIEYPNRPVVGVSWYEAAAYCKWAGGRLPTEAEWECAARCGREGVCYPWGNGAPDKERANFSGSLSHPTPVGLYPGGATPVGIHDLAGNVDEWVQDWWGDYFKLEASNPKGPDKGTLKVLRGGAWVYGAWFLRVSYRHWFGPNVRYSNLGFRCARELFSL